SWFSPILRRLCPTSSFFTPLMHNCLGHCFSKELAYHIFQFVVTSYLPEIVTHTSDSRGPDYG
ncbi:hypothetical protein NDU88_002121, partial [Pleurodeles waltl]